MSNKSSPKENPDYRPRATSSRSAYLLGGLAVLVVALVVGGIIWTSNKSYPPVDEKVLAENASFIVGAREAPVTVDVFEDFGCPHCKDFEAESGTALAAAVQAGQLRVRYHLLTFQDGQSKSGSYSSRGAGAILCVARNGQDGDVKVFNRLHADLFAESGDDPDNARIADLAAQAGANDQVRTCIADGAGVDEAKSMAATSAKQLENSNEGVVATPTVLVAGEPVDISSGDAWVSKLVTSTPAPTK